MKIEKLLEEYCYSFLKNINEAGRARKRGGGLPTPRQRKARAEKQLKNVTRSQLAQQNNDKYLIENHHEPIILSVLDDVSDTEREVYSVTKEFIGFAKPNVAGHSLQRRYVNERFLSKNDFEALEIYNKSRRDLESIDIGKSGEPFLVPITYILLSDIEDYYDDFKSRTRKYDAPDLKKSSLSKRRYDSKEGGYMYTSNEVKVQVLNALKHLGLVSLGKDIKDISITSNIQQDFVRHFNRLGWKDSVRKLGFTPGITEKEASKVIKQNQGVRRDRDADSVSKTNDLLGIMASGDLDTYYLGMNKQEFDDAIEALAVMISDPEIVFTLGFVIKNWTKCANISEQEMKEIIDLSMDHRYEEAEVMIRSFMARGYQEFMDTKVKRDSDLEKIRIKKEIEIDEQGYPTNLSDKELSDYYGVIYRDINFAEFVLPSIISKKKKAAKSTFNPMSTPPVPEWALRGTTAFDRAFVKSWRQSYK